MAEYKLIETVIIENQPHKAGQQWKFAGALYFVTVVVAMIGGCEREREREGGGVTFFRIVSSFLIFSTFSYFR